MQKRLLIFSPFYSPSNFPEAIVTGKFVLAIRQRDWLVDVVCAPAPENASDTCKTWEPLRDGVSLTRIYPKSLRTAVDRLLGMVTLGHATSGISWARQALSIGRELMKRNRYTALMSRSRPVYAHLPAMMLRRETGIPWIASWNDPPNRDPAPYGPGPNGKVSFWDDRAVAQAAAAADYNLFCCDRLRDYSAAMYPEMAERSEIIPHIGFPFAGATAAVDPNVFTLLHVGTLDSVRDPRVFLEGLDRFLAAISADDRTKVLVQFVGAHRIDSELQRLASERGRQVIRVEPWCDYEESLRRISAATALLMIEALMDKGYLLLAKFADYGVSPRPILAVSPRVGTAADIFAAYGGGIVADNRDPAAVASALGKLFDGWQHGKLEIEFDKRAIREYFSPENAADNFEKLVARLIPGSSQTSTVKEGAAA